MSVRVERPAEARVDVVLDRPRKRNALTLDMLDAVAAAVEQAAKGATVVVLRAATPAAFSAGADLAEWDRVTEQEEAAARARGAEAIDRVARAPVTVLAQVEGHCLGGGLELALACDLRLAAEDASLGFPEVRLGAQPSWGGVPRAVAAVGPSHAKALLLTGEPISGTEAARIGLVAAAVPADRVAAHVDAVAASVAADPRGAVAALRDLVDELAG